jgi:tagatose 1,6-diphosphate aldolase
VAEGARLAVACGAKVLKLQYPGSAEGCAAVTAAADGVPWAVLSAGVGHEEFCSQLAASLDGGAAGFIAGRSLWKEAVGMEASARRAFLDGTVRRRFEDLLGVLDARGQVTALGAAAVRPDGVGPARAAGARGGARGGHGVSAPAGRG